MQNIPYEKCKENHICAACGKQDERTLSGMAMCTECAKKRQSRQKKRYEQMRAERRCVSCGDQDERTLSGGCVCAICAAKRSISIKRMFDQRRESRVCRLCKALLPDGYDQIYCPACKQSRKEYYKAKRDAKRMARKQKEAQ